MPQRAACWALHYGKEYLPWSVRGAQEAVNELHFFYAAQPSFGFCTPGAANPDSRAELIEAAQRFATKPVHWHDVRARTEGEHRDGMLHVLHGRGIEQYLVCDADEVWDPESALQALNASWDDGRAGRWSVPFYHFWQSWQYRVEDWFRPIRIVDMRLGVRGPQAHVGEHVPAPRWPVFHFGYAQSLAIMRYKLSCHGHGRELRARWIDEKYLTWTPGDVDMHPTANNLWTPRETDADVLAKLAELMPDHPYLRVHPVR